MPPQAAPQAAPPAAVAQPPAGYPLAAPQAYGVRPGSAPPPDQPTMAPQQSAQPVQPGQQSAQPGQPGAPAAVVPEAPQRQDSGAIDVVPLVPGQEAQVLPPGTAPATGELPPGTPGAEAPQGTYRQRRPPRQVPVGEQVLRSLQNGTN